MSEECSADSCACSSRPARRAAAAASAAGTFSNPTARSSIRSSPGNGLRQRADRRTRSTPTPAGPPHLWAEAAAADQPSGSGSRPADAHASTNRGDSTTSATSSTGCTTPTSGLADWTASDRGHTVLRDGSGDAVGGDPAVGIHLDGLEPAAARGVPGAGLQDGRVLDAAGQQEIALPGPAGEEPEHPEVHRMRPAGCERHLVRGARRGIPPPLHGRCRASAGPREPVGAGVAGRRTHGPGPVPAPPAPRGAAAPPRRGRGTYFGHRSQGKTYPRPARRTAVRQ